MPEPSPPSVLDLLRALEPATFQWKRETVRREAALQSAAQPDVQRLAAIEAVLVALVELRAAAAAFPPAVPLSDETQAGLQDLWRQTVRAFEDPADDEAAFLRQAAALSALEAALEQAANLYTQKPLDDVFDAGDIDLDDLRAQLHQVVAETAWDAAETELGVPMPPTIRDAPLDVDTHGDAFGGKGGFAIRYPAWATDAARAGLRRLLEGDWIPKLQARSETRVLGARRPAEEDEVATIRQILFGTNRRLKDGAFTAACASGVDPLTFGQVDVSVPLRRGRGTVPRPPSILGLKLPARARKHIMLTAAATLLSREAFLAAIGAHQQKTAFLFVHGYNTPFEAGLWRTAQLAVDMEIEGPLLHYAWPSAAAPLLYDYDSENVKASQGAFKAFIRTLLDDAGVTALSVVAHSKGNELVLDAFANLADEMRGQRRALHLVLASPDVDEAVAEDRLHRASAFFQSVTLYANPYDRPLVLSGSKAGRARIGGVMEDSHPYIAANVDTIDAADTDSDWFGFNHDAYVDAPILMYDLGALLKRGVRPPDHRSPVIRPQECDRGQYYRVATR